MRNSSSSLAFFFFLTSCAGATIPSVSPLEGAADDVSQAEDDDEPVADPICWEVGAYGVTFDRETQTRRPGTVDEPRVRQGAHASTLVLLECSSGVSSAFVRSKMLEIGLKPATLDELEQSFKVRGGVRDDAATNRIVPLGSVWRGRSGTEYFRYLLHDWRGWSLGMTVVNRIWRLPAEGGWQFAGVPLSE